MSSLDDHFPDPKWSEQMNKQGEGGSHQSVKETDQGGVLKIFFSEFR